MWLAVGLGDDLLGCFCVLRPLDSPAVRVEEVVAYKVRVLPQVAHLLCLFLPFVGILNPFHLTLEPLHLWRLQVLIQCVGIIKARLDSFKKLDNFSVIWDASLESGGCEVKILEPFASGFPDR